MLTTKPVLYRKLRVEARRKEGLAGTKKAAMKPPF
jgi:hypothetical protein